MNDSDVTGCSGITSAYAEKSIHRGLRHRFRRNYLRIRGEETEEEEDTVPAPELPPHTRRRGWMICAVFWVAGITSAYAEKSDVPNSFRNDLGNYLRIRGEEQPGLQKTPVLKELPPHTRRRECCFAVVACPLGITSAYAEKRRFASAEYPHFWNYLRIRGEEPTVFYQVSLLLELPPHTRRRARRVV